MFTASADFYDALYSGKDYRGETDRLAELLEARVPHLRTLLDVGCATGAHLAHLVDRYRVEGADLDPRLLEQARRRLPTVPFTECDLCELDLGRRFDAVVCLYGTIAYVRSVPRLRLAVRRLAAHLRSGGCLVVEPWYRSAEQCPPMQVRHVDLGALKIARLSRTVLRAGEAQLDVHYLVGRDGLIEHAQERHRLGVFSDADHLDAFKAAGLEVAWVPDALGAGSHCFVAIAAPDG